MERTPRLLVVVLFLSCPAVSQVCGDCSGDASVNILDALLAAQHGVGVATLTGVDLCMCDVDSGGAVDVLDALRVAQTSAGITVTLTCTNPCTITAPPGGYPGEGTGTHYWIDAASGNDSNPGSMAMPWQTADRLESATLAPGDLVHFVAGLYDISGSLRLTGFTGSSLAWIGLQAEGAVTLRNSALQNVINLEDCHFLFLRGFEITHDNAGAPYASWDAVDGVKFQNAASNDVALDSCRIHDVGNVGCSSQAPLITNITVVDCEIHDCYTGLYWGYYEAASKRYAHDGLIARNFIHDCPPIDLDGTGYGLQIKGGSRGNVIEDNVFVNVAGDTRAAIAVYHISTDLGVETSRNVIRRNFIRGSRNEGIYASEGALIENNVVMDSEFYGINVSRRDTGGWGVFYGNLTLRNNTVFRVNDSSGRAMLVVDGVFDPPLEVSSNLLVASGGSQLALRLPGGFSGTSTANHCVGGTSGPTGGIVTLPDLSSLLSTTYGSPDFLFPDPMDALVGGGDPALASAEDFNETTRDTAPDAGAYESTGGGNPGWTLANSFKP